MVASMFFAWIDFGGISASGLSIAWHDDHWLFIVPAAGAWLAATASARSEHTRLAAGLAGLVVAGDVAWEMAKDMLHMPVEGWLIVGGAAVILLGVPHARRALRLIGGVAVLAGFVMARVYTEADTISVSGLLLWVIPLAGVVASLSAFASDPKAGRIALAAGASVYGVLVLLLGLAAYFVFGLGAWGAFGASALALVAGFVIPARAERAEQTA